MNIDVTGPVRILGMFFLTACFNTPININTNCRYLKPVLIPVIGMPKWRRF